MSSLLAARQEGVSTGMLCQWRKLELQVALTAVSACEAVVPASELAAARAEIAKLQGVLGKKTLEKEILKEAVEHDKSGLRAHTCATCLNAVMTGQITLRDDAELLTELRQEIAYLPSYGYRRACG